MKPILSCRAVSDYVNTEFKIISCLLFEGEMPTDANNLGFNPKNLGDASRSACLSFFSGVSTDSRDPDTKQISHTFNIVPPSITTQAHFQPIPANLLHSWAEYTKVNARCYIDDENPRNFGAFIAKNQISAPKYGSQGAMNIFYLNTYYWTYFEFTKAIEIKDIHMVRHRYSGTDSVALEYFDEVEEQWKDITGNDIESGRKNIHWSGPLTNSAYSVTYGGTNNHTWYPYRVIFTNPVTAKKIRVRAAVDANPSPATARDYTMYNFSVGTTSDVTDIEREITPTWGIAYGSLKSEGATENVERNPYCIFSIGSEDSGADLEITQTTFDPKTTLFSSLVSKNISIISTHIL
tara:strand:- start:225 stop:1274 length:1050 start_codon:yes stop_codon:yes gene_type:complete